MSVGDLIVIGIIAALALGAVFVLWNDHRKGRSSCGCNCSGCSKSKSCGSPIVKIDDENSCNCCKKE